MAGYSCVTSLKQTIRRLIDSVKFSLDSATVKTLELAYKNATSLQEILTTLEDGGRGGKRLNTLNAQISEAVHKLEDFLELHQSVLFLEDDNMLIDSERVREEVSFFAESVKKLREDHMDEPDEEYDDGGGDSTATATESSEMVGFSDEITSMKYHVSSVLRPEDCGVVSIVGAAGTGRSLAAKRVLDEVRGCRERGFDHCLWVRVGSVYKHETILQHILYQLLITENGGSRAIKFRGGEKTAKEVIPWILGWRRYLIVLDDVWDTDILEYLLPLFPLQNNQSAVMVTTWSMRIAMHAKPYNVYRMDDVHLNYGDMYWDIFRYVLFRRQPIPPEMEDAGRKIARNCRGMSLCACKVLLFLWNTERTQQMWNQLASDQHNPLFHVVDELLEMQKLEKDFSNITVEPDTHDILSAFVLDNALSVDVKFIKNLLFPERSFPKMEVIAFVGMAGIGKTTFVKKIFEYLQSWDQFNPRPRVCVWLSLGPKYDPEDILTDILTQIFPRINKKRIKEMDNDLMRKLSTLRFLLVLDDVWSEEPLLNLAKLYPNIWGRALVTTRSSQVAKSEMIDIIREMRFLTKEESWDLLCHKVFGEGGLCPHELKKSGRKIAENCDGLPLTVIKVAKLISKDLSPQYWNDVANKNSDFKNAIQELSEGLLPWYKTLPLHLRSCFLYMGVFPLNYEVSSTLLFNLWISEGFLELGLSERVEDFAVQCLLELVNRSLVMVCQKGSAGCGVKTCRLNSVLWHLSISEAVRSEFFHDYDQSIQGKKNQRRFCIRNCILLSVKGVGDSMMDSSATARSLVCTGPFHRFQLPLCFQLSLLRVLHVVVIRFYEFPIEVVKLIHLRHLAITCDGNLPTSISGLWNLQFLIVRRHSRIISSSSSSYLPSEIWDMKELRHLQVMGSSLPTPSCGTILPNLVTLLDVNSHTCFEMVLKATPNLEKLGIQSEMGPGDAPSFHHLNHISDSLSKLKSFKCVVMNPEIVALPPPPLSAFASSIEKLSLSGLGYPWEYMNIIGQLQNLLVLKLHFYAFQGEKWETGDYVFKKLTHLMIEDTDLVCWKTTVYSFSKLKHLSIKHCYNLEELPSDFVRNEIIEVVDCNPFAAKWANIMKDRNGLRVAPNVKDVVLETHVESSWDVGQRQYERKTQSETPYDRYISSLIDRWG